MSRAGLGAAPAAAQLSPQQKAETAFRGGEIIPGQLWPASFVSDISIVHLCLLFSNSWLLLMGRKVTGTQ